MATGQLGAVFRQIGRLFGPGTISGLTEAQLLSRFIERRDEAAFEALVSRFGPMVLGVCRQMLADPHAADDAFQATFLVLVKRAKSIRDRELLGNWLYGVALKVSRRARADLAKRRSREKEGQTVAAEPIGEGPALDDLELGPILHEELAKLPEKYRAPMVLCYLDGQTCEEAAGRLGWPVGTVKGRLSRAKDLLRARLSKRGVTASAALVAATLTNAAEASVSPMLLDQTVKAAMVLAAGGAFAAAGLGSAAAVALAEGVSTTMILAKWKTFALAATLVGTLAGSAAVMARQFGGGGASQEKAKRRPDAGGGASTSKADSVDPPGPPVQGEPGLSKFDFKALRATPLPKENESTAQLLKDRVDVARRKLDAQAAFYENGTITIDRLLQAVLDYSDAVAKSTPSDRDAAIKAIEDRVRINQAIFAREKAKFEVGQGALPNVAEAELGLLDARIALSEARAGGDNPNTPKPAARSAGDAEIGAIGAAKNNPGGIGQPAESDDPDADKRIMAELAKPISMPFAQETPLEEVIKYIKTATTGPGFEQGLPIYVDPQGLEDAEKTISSPVALYLDGIKLKTTLRLILKQLGLGYYVKDGLIIITNLENPEYRDAIHPGWRQMRADMGGGMGGMGGMGGGMGGRGGGGFGGQGGAGGGSGGGQPAMPAGGGGAVGGGKAPAADPPATPKGGGGFR